MGSFKEPEKCIILKGIILAVKLIKEVLGSSLIIVLMLETHLNISCQTVLTHACL